MAYIGGGDRLSGAIEENVICDFKWNAVFRGCAFPSDSQA